MSETERPTGEGSIPNIEIDESLPASIRMSHLGETLIGRETIRGSFHPLPANFEELPASIQSGMITQRYIDATSEEPRE